MLTIEKPNRPLYQPMMMLGLLLVSFALSYSILNVLDPRSNTASRNAEVSSSEKPAEETRQEPEEQSAPLINEPYVPQEEQPASTAYENSGSSQPTSEAPVEDQSHSSDPASASSTQSEHDTEQNPEKSLLDSILHKLI